LDLRRGESQTKKLIDTTISLNAETNSRGCLTGITKSKSFHGKDLAGKKRETISKREEKLCGMDEGAMGTSGKENRGTITRKV
jgi:hypothetical protein